MATFPTKENLSCTSYLFFIKNILLNFSKYHKMFSTFIWTNFSKQKSQKFTKFSKLWNIYKNVIDFFWFCQKYSLRYIWQKWCPILHKFCKILFDKILQYFIKVLRKLCKIRQFCPTLLKNVDYLCFSQIHTRIEGGMEWT